MTRQAPDSRGLRVVKEGTDWLVVDKPAGLLVHPTKPDSPRTLWDQLREYLAFELVNGGQVSLINRLDRETSGLVLVATTAEKARQFGLAMAARRVTKEYFTLVNGWPEWEEKTVEAPLLREGSIRESSVYLKRCIDPAGESALTHFNVLERRTHSSGLRYSLLQARPVTGRTHQIRVHIASCGHWILGDKLYGPSSALYLEFIKTGWTNHLERQLLLPRHALHASRLAVEIDGQTWEWQSGLPEDFTDWMESKEKN